MSKNNEYVLVPPKAPSGVGTSIWKSTLSFLKLHFLAIGAPNVYPVRLPGAALLANSAVCHL